MLPLLGRIPTSHFHVACSGGSDSMILLDFLMKYPKNKFDVIHFNHKTEYCQEADDFITNFCNKHGIELHKGFLDGEKSKNESQEEFWRNKRYEFFDNFKNEPILLAHHLNDCVETWIMTSLHGCPRLIPYNNKRYNIYRPLLATSKTLIEDWAIRHKVEYVMDHSNFDTTINRNYVRYELMKHVYRLNPGIEKTIHRLIIEKYKQEFKNE